MAIAPEPRSMNLATVVPTTRPFTMRLVTLFLALTYGMSGHAQLGNPGFETNGGWSSTCPDWWYATDVPIYGGTRSLAMTMLSSTQPNCFHIDGIEPVVYQALSGVQNGTTVNIALMAKGLPDIPANVNSLLAFLGIGWLTAGSEVVVGSSNGQFVQDSWVALFLQHTLAGMPSNATPVLILGGNAFANANGTVLFDNVSVVVAGSGAQISPKAWLDGPYLSGQNLMRDDLRAAGLLPLSSPYGAYAPGTIAPSVLAVNGPDAVVDWMVVELYALALGAPVHLLPALLQADGDIVALDGTSPLDVPVAKGLFYVRLRHRNHLGVVSAVLTPIGPGNTVVDFRSPNTDCLVRPAPDNDLPRKTVGNTCTLWAADLNGDHLVKYTGSFNDRDNILSVVGSSTPTNPVNGYYILDVNLDGIVKYAGAANDRDFLLQTIGGIDPTVVRIEQVP
jgi:hypothetical protein